MTLVTYMYSICQALKPRLQPNFATVPVELVSPIGILGHPPSGGVYTTNSDLTELALPGNASPTNRLCGALRGL